MIRQTSIAKIVTVWFGKKLEKSKEKPISAPPVPPGTGKIEIAKVKITFKTMMNIGSALSAPTANKIK